MEYVAGEVLPQFLCIVVMYLSSGPSCNNGQHAYTTSLHHCLAYTNSPIDMDSVDPEDLYKRDPPTFGHELLRYFPLDPNYINLNHGTFIPVDYFHSYLLIYHTAKDHSESHPTWFIKSQMI